MDSVVTPSLPIVGITTWRRELTTYLGPGTDLHTLGVEYVRCLENAGVQPVLLASPQHAAAVLERLDGVVLSGGGDVHPASYGEQASQGDEYDLERDEAEVALVDEARRLGMPVLGICRGLQVIGIARGVTLVPDLPRTDEHPRPHDPQDILDARQKVSITAHSRLATIFSSDQIVVNSIHHQALAEVPIGFRPAAHSQDGYLEGIEGVADDWYCVGVQWHPEKMGHPGEAEQQALLFADFAAACSRYASSAQSWAKNHRREK